MAKQNDGIKTKKEPQKESSKQLLNFVKNVIDFVDNDTYKSQMARYRTSFVQDETNVVEALSRIRDYSVIIIN
jgi:hypothetical protein